MSFRHTFRVHRAIEKAPIYYIINMKIINKAVDTMLI